MFKKILFSTLIVSGLIISGCSSDDDDESSGSDTVENSEGGDGASEGDNGAGDTDAANPTATPGEGNSAYDVIVNSTDHSILRMAIDLAGLADALDNEANEFTVFAPSDTAFAALPAGVNLQTLLDDPQGQLSSILTFHVVAGATVDSTAASEAIANGPTTLTTLNGAELTVASSDGPAGISVGGVDVQIADVEFDPMTSTGVVHSIDSVLIPPPQ